MRAPTPVILSALWLSACATATSPEDLVEARLHEADARFEARLYDEAARLYEFVAERRPMRKHAHVRAAACYQQTGQWMTAIQIYEHVRARIDHHDLFVLHNLADLYLATGFAPEAAETFQTILRLVPGDPHAQEGLRCAMERMMHVRAAAAPRAPAADAPAPFAPAPQPPAPEPPKEPPPPEPPASERFLREADRLLMEAAAVARRLAVADLSDERERLLPLRLAAAEASTLLGSAVLKYREAAREAPSNDINAKIDMAIQVRAYVDKVLVELDRRLGP
jgi:tetratricopeptide (TPR) repeat protein